MAEAINRRAAAHRLQDRPSLTAEAVTMARALEHLKPPEQRVIDDPWAHLFLSRRQPRPRCERGPAASPAAPCGGSAPPARRGCRCATASSTTTCVAALDGGARPGRAARRRLRHRAPTASPSSSTVARCSRSTCRPSAAPRRRRSPSTPTSSRRRRSSASRWTSSSSRSPTCSSIAGLEPEAPTYVTWEGVPMYLTRAAVKATLDAVHDVVGAGSVIAHDMWTVVDDPGLHGHRPPARADRPSASSASPSPSASTPRRSAGSSSSAASRSPTS